MAHGWKYSLNIAAAIATADMLSTCADQEGGAGVHTPPPPENQKFIGFPSNTGPDPLEITKLPSQHSTGAIIGPPAKRHVDGVSQAGR